MSEEYVLQRLDRWYNARVADRWTDDVELHVMGAISELVDTQPDEKRKMLSPMRDFVIQSHSRLQQKMASEGFFSIVYPRVEAMNAGEFPPEIDLDTAGLAYMETLNAFRPVVDFVNETRSRFDRVFPLELSDDDIAYAFKKSFVDYRGFAAFSHAYTGAMASLLEATAPTNLAASILMMRTMAPLTDIISKYVFENI